MVTDEDHLYYDESCTSYFDPSVAQHCLEKVLRKHLDNQVYNATKVTDWMNAIITDIGLQLQSMDLSRYKWIINVNILRWTEDANMTTDCLCFWDEDTDRIASYTYRNGSIFSNAVIYAVHID